MYFARLAPGDWARNFSLGQNIMIDIPALGRGGPVLFLQLKSTKKPRLPDICCKSTLYPVDAIRAV